KDLDAVCEVSFGWAHVMGETMPGSSVSLTGFYSKHCPKSIVGGGAGSFAPGQGDYPDGRMFFPTKGSFIIQGMAAGPTELQFSPKAEGKAVLEILYEGKDVIEAGIETKPGERIQDVRIVIGAP
ncbi:MAG TPA: hypothetical protein VM389_03970, partial [Phycisphaerae bacterium]|nr:hypothetical protein [Phycisphaerae bacterium]